MFRFSLRLLLCAIIFIPACGLVWLRNAPWIFDHTVVSKTLPKYDLVDPSNTHSVYLLRIFDNLDHRIICLFDIHEICRELLKIRSLNGSSRMYDYEEPWDEGFIDAQTIVFIYGINKDKDISQQESFVEIYYTRTHPEQWWGHICRPEIWLALIFGTALIIECKSKPWIKQV